MKVVSAAFHEGHEATIKTHTWKKEKRKNPAKRRGNFMKWQNETWCIYVAVNVGWESAQTHSLAGMSWEVQVGTEPVSLVVTGWRNRYLFQRRGGGCMSRVCGSAANDSGLLMKSDSADVCVGGAVQPGSFSLHLHMQRVVWVAQCNIRD